MSQDKDKRLPTWILIVGVLLVQFICLVVIVIAYKWTLG